MYVIEGHKHGFSSIPMSIYWAVVTLTTVGYGDIAPVTPLGKILASMVMIMGYAIIAVPTGIVTAELTRADRSTTTLSCRNCSAEAHPDGAKFCYQCGHDLNWNHPFAPNSKNANTTQTEREKELTAAMSSLQNKLELQQVLRQPHCSYPFTHAFLLLASSH